MKQFIATHRGRIHQTKKLRVNAVRRVCYYIKEQQKTKFFFSVDHKGEEKGAENTTRSARKVMGNNTRCKKWP
jgi:hypothetical protein